MTADAVKFLVVDDVEENLTALEALLRREGLEILKARSGREALELLLVNEVALAILDVQMPEMTGFELAELMRGAERTKHVPIIFVTAGARDPQGVFKGYETGAVDFLFKPIDPHIMKSKCDVFFELHRQRKELANSLRLTELFVGILGHDLRNPLGVIVTGAHLLARQSPSEDAQRTLRRMTLAGERMTGMIDQLLDLTHARMMGGRGFVGVRRDVDIAQLVRRTIDELRVVRAGREVALRVAGNTATRGDPDRLLQLFSNVVANAMNHGTPGTDVSVTIESGDGSIFVTVANQGMIAPEALPTLFDPFRARTTRSSQSSGLGLGLFIAQQIALAQGGQVTVESNAESGTTFTVRLPALIGHGPPSDRRRTRVLVVEDDRDIREPLVEILTQEGYEVSAAADGLEALRWLGEAREPPDLILLDLTMPNMTGVEFRAEQLKHPHHAAIPVAVVSADSNGRQVADELKAAAFLKKPVRIESLLDLIDRIARHT